MIPIDEVVILDVVTQVFATGVATDADAAPTFDVFEEDTDTPILSAQTMTKRTSKTGNYRGSITCSAANGFEAGKWYTVVVSATVSTVAGKCVAKHFRVAPAESAAGVPKADLSHWLGTAPLALSSQQVQSVVPTTQKVDVETIKTQAVTAAAGVTFPGSIASPTNITAGTVTTATNLTNAPPDSSGVTTLLSRLSALRAGYLDNLSAGAAALESSLQALITTVGAAGAGLTATATAVWAVATRLLTAGTNIVLAKGVGVTGFNDLSAAQVNTEADLALADVGLTTTITGRVDAAISTRATPAQVNTEADTALADAALATAANLATVAGYLDTEIGAIKAKTDTIPASPAAVGDIPTALQNADALLARDLGSGTGAGSLDERTVRSALRFNRNKFTIAGGVLTVYEEDDTTVAWTAVITQTAGNPVSASDPV